MLLPLLAPRTFIRFFSIPTPYGVIRFIHDNVGFSQFFFCPFVIAGAGFEPAMARWLIEYSRVVLSTARYLR